MRKVKTYTLEMTFILAMVVYFGGMFTQATQAKSLEQEDKLTKTVSEVEKRINTIEEKVEETVAKVTPKEIEHIILDKSIFVQPTEPLNLRESHTMDSEVVRVLNTDEVIEVTEIYNNMWYKTVDGKYLSKNFVINFDGNIEDMQKNAEGYYVPKVVLSTSPVAKSNLSVDDIERIVEGSQLDGIGDAVIEVENEFGINALFTLSVAMLESGHGTSTFAQTRNNLFGMNAEDDNPNKAFRYNSKGESIIDFGERIKKYYIDQGLTTLNSIGNKYCPGPNKEWDVKIENVIESNINKLN